MYDVDSVRILFAGVGKISVWCAQEMSHEAEVIFGGDLDDDDDWTATLTEAVGIVRLRRDVPRGMLNVVSTLLATSRRWMMLRRLPASYVYVVTFHVKCRTLYVRCWRLRSDG